MSSEQIRSTDSNDVTNLPFTETHFTEVNAQELCVNSACPLPLLSYSALEPLMHDTDISRHSALALHSFSESPSLLPLDISANVQANISSNSTSEPFQNTEHVPLVLRSTMSDRDNTQGCFTGSTGINLPLQATCDASLSMTSSETLSQTDVMLDHAPNNIAEDISSPAPMAELVENDVASHPNDTCIPEKFADQSIQRHEPSVSQTVAPHEHPDDLSLTLSSFIPSSPGPISSPSAPPVIPGYRFPDLFRVPSWPSPTDISHLASQASLKGKEQELELELEQEQVEESFSSSLPPSSSPPRLFSSQPQPFASSQSSLPDSEPDKAEMDANVIGSAKDLPSEEKQLICSHNVDMPLSPLLPSSSPLKMEFCLPTIVPNPLLNTFASEVNKIQIERPSEKNKGILVIPTDGDISSQASLDAASLPSTIDSFHDAPLIHSKPLPNPIAAESTTDSVTNETLKNLAVMEDAIAVNCSPGFSGPSGVNKRPRSLEDGPQNLLIEAADAESPVKRMKKDHADTKSMPPPVPKRSTVASQRLQHQKLATPFRSPLMKQAGPSANKSRVHPEIAEGASQSLSVDREANPLRPNESNAPDPAGPSSVSTTSAPTATAPPLPAAKKYTPKAASQFKSPFSSTLSSSPALPAVRLTPTIQALERKIQILKRAVKVRKDGEQATLEDLVKKWTEAGRQVAWEVWGLVKDMGDDGGSGGKGWGDDKGWGRKDNKRGMEDGWGWDAGDTKRRKMYEPDGEKFGGWEAGSNDDSENTGQCGSKGKKRGDEDEEEEEKKSDTPGTMLRQLGIDPDTLGWDEEEGEFVDV